ncbi:MAG: RAMP superfamily CRISPR-associated protein [Candidatus Aenigmatarchaeota archaeon]
MSIKDFKIKLENISPIHVGTGESYKSYFIKDGWRLNSEKILNILIEKKLERSDYRKPIYLEEEEIKNFVKSTNFDDSFKMYKIEHEKNIEEVGVEIQEIIKADGRQLIPIIPGSSLKGFFVTALLNELSISEGKLNLKKIIKKPKNISRLYEMGKIPNLYISDCFPINQDYKIIIGKVLVKRGFYSEFVINFKSKTVVQIEENFDIENVLTATRNFMKSYIEIIERKASDALVKKIIENVKIDIENLKSNQAIITIGKYGGIYSKTVPKYIRILNKKGIRVVEVNGKKYLPGLVKIEIEQL